MDTSSHFRQVLIFGCRSKLVIRGHCRTSRRFRRPRRSLHHPRCRFLGLAVSVLARRQPLPCELREWSGRLWLDHTGSAGCDVADLNGQCVPRDVLVGESMPATGDFPFRSSEWTRTGRVCRPTRDPWLCVVVVAPSRCPYPDKAHSRDNGEIDSSSERLTICNPS